MKYYKKGDIVYAFESDGCQDSYINNDMVKMTSDEVDRHINPTKYLTSFQVYQNYLASLKPLTRRQFKLVLLDNNLLSEVESKIDSIADEQTKQRIQIEYTEATEFRRTSDSVKYMCGLLQLSEEQVNTMWEQALTY